ncbi:MAG: hypothetical protein Q9159_001228 [Coniocarpon cinnabarinum]
MHLNTVRVLLCLGLLIALATPSHAFGAGNIASIAKIEGSNWRHGDIEDMLSTVAHLKGYKWSSMMIKRVYFGNWLRDYSQAVDVGTLKGVQAGAIRVLVWILAFISFGYATREFEVTEERLGVYRPEEHIDNPEDYADNIDARQYDPRLRGPVHPDELGIDPDTGMKNYIANDRGGWATSSGYVRFSFSRSIHFGRLFTSGSGNSKGRQEDLFEALRCLGQGLHCLEDFGAHTNYCELALRELGFHNVFPHVGQNTEINLHSRRVYPLVTGTFGGVDFLHSVLGEAGDHVTQSEVEVPEVDQMKRNMEGAAQDSTSRGFDAEQQASGLTDLLGKVPGCGNLCSQAIELQRASNAQAQENSARGFDTSSRDAPSFLPPPGSDTHIMMSGAQNPNMPAGQQGGATLGNVDLAATVAKIYPILEFRDNVVRAISSVVEKIPGLEKLIETISEKITLFIMGLLAPYIIPVINAASSQLKTGSSTVVKAAAKHQYAPWTDPNCTAPTHSMLSKDHFSNVLNNPAGHVAAAILQYAAPRVVYAWEHPGVPIDQVLDDIVGPGGAFHHPAIRQPNREIHQNMFRAVQRWVDSQSDRGASLNQKLSSDSVRHGHNHTAGAGGVMGSGTNQMPSFGNPHEAADVNTLGGFGANYGGQGHGGASGGLGQFAGKLFSGSSQPSHSGGGGGGLGSLAGQFLGSSNQGGLGKLAGGVFGSREMEGTGREVGDGGMGGGISGGFNYGSVAPDAVAGSGQHLAPGWGTVNQEGTQSTYEAMQQRRSVSPFPDAGNETAQRMFGYEHQSVQEGGYGGEGYQQGGYAGAYSGGSGYGGETYGGGAYGGGAAYNEGYGGQYGSGSEYPAQAPPPNYGEGYGHQGYQGGYGGYQ